MILPTKHIRAERAIIGIGGKLLELLHESMTVSALWDVFRQRRTIEVPSAPISYDWFVLTLGFLFMIGAVEIRRGLLSRVGP